MTHSVSSRWRRMRAFEGLALGAVAVAARLVPPDRPLPFSVCGWKALTSIDCPGCGLTRAVCHALHGDLAGSIDLHVAGPAVALALIVGALWLLAEAATARPLGAALRPRLITAGLWGGGVVSVVAWAVRLAEAM
jgi:hypothetical protein